MCVNTLLFTIFLLELSKCPSPVWWQFISATSVVHHSHHLQTSKQVQGNLLISSHCPEYMSQTPAVPQTMLDGNICKANAGGLAFTPDLLHTSQLLAKAWYGWWFSYHTAYRKIQGSPSYSLNTYQPPNRTKPNPCSRVPWQKKAPVCRAAMHSRRQSSSPRGYSRGILPLRLETWTRRICSWSSSICSSWCYTGKAQYHVCELNP